MKHRYIVFAFLSVVALAGCGGSIEGKLVGKWKGGVRMARDLTPNRATRDKLATISLEFKADKTFEMNMGMPMEGTWSVDAKQVTLVATKVGGMSIEEAKKQAEKMGAKAEDADKPLILELSADGQELTIASGQAPMDTSTFSFKKETDAS
ncbi:MAG: hypothetical protein HYR64_03900 [Fimbriimonas ginsengisoli]|uniref:Uncharacterized protein n=1 Tax=Fimbriimonas ginsengisoli TaxID=1005039 RepID=A0A931LRQ8_FIMGI|nr:hypothetical protein [Fimbriimonas ginsengisoli]